MSQDKAQPAVNGYSLNKGCNAVLGYLWASLWARREAVICGVASLVKGTPFRDGPQKQDIPGVSRRLFC